MPDTWVDMRVLYLARDTDARYWCECIFVFQMKLECLPSPLSA